MRKHCSNGVIFEEEVATIKASHSKEALAQLKIEITSRSLPQPPAASRSPLRGGTDGSRGLCATAMIRAMANTSIRETSYPFVCPRYFSTLPIISVNLPGCSVGMKIMNPNKARCQARCDAIITPSSGPKPP